MAKKPPKHPRPEQMTNGEFSTTGGFEVYKLLWGLQGRMARVEAAVGLGAVLLGAILTKLMEWW